MSKKERALKHAPSDQAVPKSSKKKSHEKDVGNQSLIKFSELPVLLIILAYIFLVTFTPNLMALDTNAPKFLSLALVNAVAFLFLITNKEIQKDSGSLLRFFNTKTGLIYAVFLFFGILSFTKAINIHESLLQFSKLFSVFTAAFTLSVMLMRNMRLVQFIAFVVSGILIFDSLSVFYYIHEFIERNISSISDIKSVYSNKNILASALFAKIPFSLWLFVYSKGWLKKMGWFSMFMGMTATFFMAARAFYVGLIVITVLFVAYSLINYLRDKQKSHLMILGGYAGALIFGFVLFSLTQTYLYPSKSGRHTQAIAQQISTISTDDGSTRIRLNAWNWSLNMVKENPLLGVGVGNWKIAVLEHENKVNKGFVYSYKAHNDFLENTAETGIFGGLFYIGIYIMLGIAFLLAFFHRKKTKALYKYLFLSASGMIFYSFDALFNFPHDRPEMAILFALYIAIGVSASYYLNRVVSDVPEDSDQESEKNRNSARSEAILSGESIDSFSHLKHQFKPWIFKTIGSIIVVVMLAVSYLFYINFESSKLQRVVYQEIMSGKLKSPSSMFVGKFPAIPNVSIWGESISVLVARYLINDNKNREAIEVLLPEKMNPYDARREFFLAMAYNNLKETDSALMYSKEAYALKPKYFRNLHLMMTLMEEKNMEKDVPDYFNKYLEEEKEEKNAWIYATGFYSKFGEIDKAYDLLQEGLKYIPNDSLMQQQQRYLHHKKFIEPNRDLYNKALNSYNAGNHSAALDLFNEYISIVPDDSNALRLRAFSLYFLKDYTRSLEEIKDYFATFGKEGSMVNLRGVCFREIGDLEKACKDFEEAMKMGVDAGKTNYDRFCRNR